MQSGKLTWQVQIESTPSLSATTMTLLFNAHSDAPRTYICLSPRPSASLTSGGSSNTPSRSLSSASQRPAPSVQTPTPYVPTPTSPLTRPTPCDDDIIKKILECAVANETQRVQIPGIDEETYDRIKSSTDARSERLRYYYDFNSCSIIINTLPSDVHESLQEYLTGSLKFSLARWVTMIVADASVTVMGSVDRDLVSAGGSKLKGKTPDQGFQVKIPDLDIRDYPNIVVEVGYSERHTDLMDDTYRWLTLTHDEPVLSVLIFCFKKP